jgi:uncharacterized protein (TIGR02611 family)
MRCQEMRQPPMMTRIRNSKWSLGLKQVRRVVIFVVGMTVLLFGIALIVLPGPAILVIPAGLAILGLEFRWARRWMRQARAVIQSGQDRWFQREQSVAPVPTPETNVTLNFPLAVSTPGVEGSESLLKSRRSGA